MDITEIEEDYKRKSEIVEKEFTLGLANHRPLSEIEPKYREKMKRVRKEYEKNMTNYINQKKSIKRKKVKSQAPFKRFIVKKTDISSTKWFRFKVKFRVLMFIFGVHLKNIWNKFYYPSLAYYFKFIKYRIKQDYKMSVLRIEKSKNSLSGRLQKKIEESKKNIEEKYNKVKDFIKSRLSRKKEEKPKDENKESPKNSSD